MRGMEARRLLILEPEQQRYRLRLLHPLTLNKKTPVEVLAQGYLLSGEALCQHLLREDPDAMVFARGPMPFLSGNKMTVGYISPQTGLPHYSFVGGRGFAALLNLGLDAIVMAGIAREEAHPTGSRSREYAVISGRAPHLSVEWKQADDLPAGQRGAFYWLLEHELGGQAEQGSILTVGEGALLGYRTANLGVDGLYHAGRGGAGRVFVDSLSALVLRGEPISWQEWFGSRGRAFWELRDGEIRERLESCTGRLSEPGGGTVTKLYTTGSGERPTLPARNAQRLGYSLADLGSRTVLKALRVGQTGCHWCQVNCRHWHWVDADYAPDGKDRLLDDFEPAYAILAMLDLEPDKDSAKGWLRLLGEVDRRLILPIEQMGCDVIDVGVGLAALFEGLERGLIPLDDVPSFLHSTSLLGDLDVAAQVVTAMRRGDPSPALRAVGDGPQMLAQRYSVLQEFLFTGGPGTLANAGHANALWTFLMPFSRFFGHYVGQLYKIEGDLVTSASPDELRKLFEHVIREALQRESFGCLGNALSTCAFTHVLFSQGGEGMTLDDSQLLVRTLSCYGIEVRHEELTWFAEAFWAQSIDFKLGCGWRPPAATDLPTRVYEALSQVLDRSQAELLALMEQLITEWKRQAGDVLYRYGYELPRGW